MLYCAACTVKNCARKMGTEGEYPRGCPSALPETAGYLAEYGNPLDMKMARSSALCSPDHSEGRILKTIRFAMECGFKKLGLAFCVTYKEEAAQLNRLLRDSGFQVESVVCKVGHCSRAEVLGVPESSNAMCNPIAQAELLNKAGTELNIALCLCVGHDSLFIRHSKAPVTVIAAKDHVYDNAPLEYLRELARRETK